MNRAQMSTETLHAALADFGITSQDGTISGKRKLYQWGEFIGEYDAHDAWQLVNDLRYGATEDEEEAA